MVVDIETSGKETKVRDRGSQQWPTHYSSAQTKEVKERKCIRASPCWAGSDGDREFSIDIGFIPFRRAPASRHAISTHHRTSFPTGRPRRSNRFPRVIIRYPRLYRCCLFPCIELRAFSRPSILFVLGRFFFPSFLSLSCLICFFYVAILSVFWVSCARKWMDSN